MSIQFVRAKLFGDDVSLEILRPAKSKLGAPQVQSTEVHCSRLSFVAHQNQTSAYAGFPVIKYFKHDYFTF